MPVGLVLWCSSQGLGRQSSPSRSSPSCSTRQDGIIAVPPQSKNITYSRTSCVVHPKRPSFPRILGSHSPFKIPRAKKSSQGMCFRENVHLGTGPPSKAAGSFFQDHFAATYPQVPLLRERKSWKMRWEQFFSPRLGSVADRNPY